MHQHGLNLDTEKCKVDTIGIGGAAIIGRKPNLSSIPHQIATQNYSLLVLNVGSNDLDPNRQPNINTSQWAREIVTQAQEIGQKFALKVMVCLPIPRAESKFPGSFDVTKTFND